jgi:outer membrane protein TolC
VAIGLRRSAASARLDVPTGSVGVTAVRAGGRPDARAARPREAASRVGMAKRRLLFVLAIGALARNVAIHGQAQTLDPPLTIDQAVALGLQQNRSIASLALEVKKTEDAIASLRTQRRPVFEVNFLEGRLLGQLNLHFPTGAFGSFPSTGPVPPQDTTISTPDRWTSTTMMRVNQPISQLHRIGLGERQLEISRDLASERVRAQQQTIASNIRRLYYGILETQDGQQSLEESLTLHREVERLVGQYIKEGVALAADGLEVQALIAKEEAATVSFRNSAATLREQLNALLGRDISTPFSVAPVPQSSLADEEMTALETRALAARPEVKEAKLSTRQAQYDVQVKRAALIPDISATVDFIGFYRFEVLPPAVAIAGVLATWEPFDWGRKRRAIAQSERTVDQATAAIADAEALVRTEVRASFRKLTEARQAVNVAELVQRAARERLRVATSLYGEQKSLSRDVLQAQAALADADRLHNDALLQLAAARADLEKAVGGT